LRKAQELERLKEQIETTFIKNAKLEEGILF